VILLSEQTKVVSVPIKTVSVLFGNYANGNKAKVGQVNEAFYVDGSESSPIYSATMLVKFTDQAIANYGKANIDLASSVAITFGLDKPPEAKNKTVYALFFQQTNQTQGIGKKVAIVGKNADEHNSIFKVEYTKFCEEVNQSIDPEWRCSVRYIALSDRLGLCSDYNPSYLSKKAANERCKYEPGELFNVAVDRYSLTIQ
jgi:hypothetical protein